METLKYVKWLLIAVVTVVFLACSSDSGGSAEEPQVDVSYPESGEIVAQVIQSNGSASIDYYGNDFDGITEIKGSVAGDTLNITISDNAASEIIVRDNIISITYNTDGTVNYTLVSADELQFEELNVAVDSSLSLVSSLSRALSATECSSLKSEMKSMLKEKVLELVGYLKALQVVSGWPPATDEAKKKLSAELTKVTIKLIIIYPEFHALLMKYREGCLGIVIDDENNNDDSETSIDEIADSNVDENNDALPSTWIITFRPRQPECESGGGTWYPTNDWSVSPNECSATLSDAIKICNINAAVEMEAFVTDDSFVHCGK